MTRIVTDKEATPFRSVLVAVLSVALAFPPTYVIAQPAPDARVVATPVELMRQKRIEVAQATPAAPAKEQANKQTNEPPKEPSDEFLSALAEVALASLSFGEAVRPAIDRSAFDQGSLLDRLDFDDTEIVSFVTDEIAYEAYAGVLRGAHGTLLARAGNALDQSLLLATLLNEAGFEAVIRAGTLPRAEAERLLRGLARRPAAPAVWRDEAALDRARAQLDTRLARLPSFESVAGRPAPPAPSRDALVAGIEHDRDQLLAALAKAGVQLGKGADPDEPLREAAEYFWVEYRTGPARPWQPVHAAFGDEPPPEVEIAATFAGDIPSERTHRLRLELLVDRRVADTVETVPLMAPMEFPSANVAGRSLSLLLLPDTLLRQERLPDEEAAAEARFLLPLVNMGLPEGAQALALNGTTVPPELIQLSQTGVFESVSERFESAASALRGLGAAEGAAEPLLAIESVRLQVTLVHPVSGSRTIERILYRAPGAASPDADARARRVALVSELAQVHSLGFVAGALADGWVLDEQIADLLSRAPLFEAWADPALFDCETLACLPVPEMDLSPAGENVTRYAASFDREMPLEPGSVVYRDAPNVIRLSAPLLPEVAPVPGVFDIVSNARRAWRIEDARPVPAPELVLLAGIAETHLERGAAGARGPVSTLEPGADGRAPALRAWTEGAAPLPSVIESDMMAKARQEGAVVLTSAAARDGAGLLHGWWEVDPVTGRTLGMTRYGGANAVEFVVLIVGLAFVAIVVVAGVACAVTDPVHEMRRGAAPHMPAQRATWLSCTFCTSGGALAGLPSGLDPEVYTDYYQYCVNTWGDDGGWE